MTDISPIACIIPTYNGKADLIRLLDSLESQTAAFDVFVVDSSSTDGTLEVARTRLGDITVIPSAEFNHGGTRQLMVDRHSGYKIYIFLTQDAFLNDRESICEIIKPFEDIRVGAVCGRQLPHLDAGPLAQHARLFNYPEGEQIKSMSDISKFGIKTPFLSNSFAAYRAEALKAVGGLPEHVILSEDMYVGAKMLMAGWKLVYANKAMCRHSHNYTILEEFKRYFDIGVFHAREPWIQRTFGGAGGEGLRYVKSELKFLGFQRLYLWPSSFLRSAAKLTGYKLGLQEAKMPIKLKRKLGMHMRFWDGLF